MSNFIQSFSLATTMKLAIIAVLIGSVAAFVPARNRPDSVQLRAFAVDLGAPAPRGLFDPLFRQDGAETLDRRPDVLRDGGVDADWGDDFEEEIALQKQAAAVPGIDQLFRSVARPSDFFPLLVLAMKVVSSIGSMKKRNKNCQVIRRRGRVYVINKSNPRLKVRQGRAKMKKHQK
mmetsp:Transcript_12376/g.27151  ORF Transcript_12376/g.27151 Transcript_12376/m.27151 type:complete len:176 (-) Transcript_12376:165-692(-)